MNNFMKKQFYKVPLVKPSQRLQKQRQPEWKVCNVDDSEFKFGIEKEKGNVKERDWKWEYKGNKGRSNKKRKGEVKNRFQKERISYEMVKSKSIGRVIKSRECARLNKEMFKMNNNNDEEIKMVFNNVGGVRTKALKNPLELNGVAVRFNSGNVSLNENDSECECDIKECGRNDVQEEKEKSVLKYNNNESNFIDNLNRVFETSKNCNEISSNNYNNNIKLKDEDYEDIHNYISKPIDDNNKTNEYNQQEYLFDNHNHLLDSNYMNKQLNANDETYNKYKCKYDLQNSDLLSYTNYKSNFDNNIDLLTQGQIHTYNDFQPKITSNAYNTNTNNIFNSNSNTQSNSNTLQHNTDNIKNNISQTNLNDINTLLSQTATTADKLSTNLPETPFQYKYHYSGNKLIYKYN